MQYIDAYLNNNPNRRLSSGSITQQYIDNDRNFDIISSDLHNPQYAVNDKPTYLTFVSKRLSSGSFKQQYYENDSGTSNLQNVQYAVNDSPRSGFYNSPHKNQSSGSLNSFGSDNLQNDQYAVSDFPVTKSFSSGSIISVPIYAVGDRNSAKPVSYSSLRATVDIKRNPPPVPISRHISYSSLDVTASDIHKSAPAVPFLDESLHQISDYKELTSNVEESDDYRPSSDSFVLEAPTVQVGGPPLPPRPKQTPLRNQKKQFNPYQNTHIPTNESENFPSFFPAEDQYQSLILSNNTTSNDEEYQHSFYDSRSQHHFTKHVLSANSECDQSVAATKIDEFSFARYNMNSDFVNRNRVSTSFSVKRSSYQDLGSDGGSLPDTIIDVRSTASHSVHDGDVRDVRSVAEVRFTRGRSVYESDISKFRGSQIVNDNFVMPILRGSNAKVVSSDERNAINCDYSDPVIINGGEIKDFKYFPEAGFVDDVGHDIDTDIDTDNESLSGEKEETHS
jgi:hypothetical protein